jgi:hypothetical protein
VFARTSRIISTVERFHFVDHRPSFRMQKTMPSDDYRGRPQRRGEIFPNSNVPRIDPSFLSPFVPVWCSAEMYSSSFTSAYDPHDLVCLAPMISPPPSPKLLPPLPMKADALEAPSHNDGLLLLAISDSERDGNNTRNKN